MSIDQRLSRLAPALTAQERAILILEAWKDGRPEEPVWRYAQSQAFIRYIDLMDVVTRDPGDEELAEMREWVASIPNP